MDLTFVEQESSRLGEQPIVDLNENSLLKHFAMLLTLLMYLSPLLTFASNQKHGYPPTNRRVLSKLEQAILYQRFLSMNKHPLIIQIFKSEIINQGIVLPDTFLLPIVLSAAEDIHNTEFVETLFHYITTRNHHNVI